jgi:hypothetical protein
VELMAEVSCILDRKPSHCICWSQELQRPAKINYHLYIYHASRSLAHSSCDTLYKAIINYLWYKVSVF